MEKGTMKEEQFYSKYLEEEMELMIYLPPAFSPLYKYHILIVQDGRDYFNLGRLAKVADQLTNQHKIEDTIIVGIPYKDRFERYEKYHPTGKKQKAYIRFLSSELVPYLDETYPTYQMGLGRALMGDSLGATVSLMTALSFPNTFGKVMMHSPMVDEAVIDKIKNFSQSHLLKLYHVIGTEEAEVETTHGDIVDFLTPNRELNRLFTEKPFDYFYDELAGNHTWRTWQPDISRALEWTLGR
jgi:enterochelin esterase-like enzyme